MTHYRIYTGPTLVDGVADRLQTADGIIVTLRGTMHVYVDAKSAEQVFDVLTATGTFTGWSLRDIQQTGGIR